MVQAAIAHSKFLAVGKLLGNICFSEKNFYSEMQNLWLYNQTVMKFSHKIEILCTQSFFCRNLQLSVGIFVKYLQRLSENFSFFSQLHFLYIFSKCHCCWLFFVTLSHLVSINCTDAQCSLKKAASLGKR